MNDDDTLLLDLVYSDPAPTPGEMSVYDVFRMLVEIREERRARAERPALVLVGG